jgi:hypothetical protein
LRLFFVLSELPAKVVPFLAFPLLIKPETQYSTAFERIQVTQCILLIWKAGRVNMKRGFILKGLGGMPSRKKKVIGNAISTEGKKTVVFYFHFEKAFSKWQYPPYC